MTRYEEPLSTGDVLRRNGELTSAHNPLSIIADPDALASLLEFEVLQKFDAVRELGIVFETAFSLPGEPLW